MVRKTILGAGLMAVALSFVLLTFSPNKIYYQLLSKTEAANILGGCINSTLQNCPTVTGPTDCGSDPCNYINNQWVCPQTDFTISNGPYQTTGNATCGSYTFINLPPYPCIQVTSCGCKNVGIGYICVSGTSQQGNNVTPRAPAGDDCPSEGGCGGVASISHEYQLLALSNGIGQFVLP